MPRLIWVFAGRTVTLLVLSCRGSYHIRLYGTIWDIFESGHSQMSRLMTKPTQWLCAQRRQISLGIRLVWSESSLCAQWVAKEPSFLHADSEDSDQTGRTCHSVGFVMRRLILRTGYARPASVRLISARWTHAEAELRSWLCTQWRRYM